jgi:NAD(P)-dependent dehydrogenase (short-subunit alcohol dehydrogenase family)
MDDQARIALVTGANRGMGFETCRQLAQRGCRVILTSRDVAMGEAAAAELAGQGLAVTYHALDVTDADSLQTLLGRLEATVGRVDVLVNNAAVYLDEGISVLDVPPETWRATMETNFFGPVALCQALIPGMLRRGYGRVVNVSSGAGQSTMTDDYAPSYSASKAALNALTRMLAAGVRAANLRSSNVLVNAVCPGWVRTEMGGPGADRSVEEGADTIVWLATLPDGGPGGGFFRDRKPIPW